MSNLRFEKSKFGKFWSGKGFYVALAVCMVAVGGVAWSALGGGSKLGTGDGASSQVVVDWGDSQAVGNDVSDVPIVVSTPVSAPASSAPSSAPASSASSAPSSKAPKETIMYPCGKKVMKPFSGEELVYSQTLKDWRTHDGTDYEVEKGTAVKAMCGGTVKSVKEDDTWGTIVEIDHGSKMSAFYCGLAKNVSVKKGDKVEIGQQIGAVGEIPCEIAEAAHLHLKITKDGKLVDPATVLAGK